MATQLFGNNLKFALSLSTVPGSLGAAATSVTLVPGGGNNWPSPTAGDYFLATLFEVNGSGAEVNHEVVKVTTRTSDTFTISVRDFENGNSGVGRTYPSAIGTNPSGIVYIALRYTAYAANNTLNKDANLAGLASAATARTNLGLGNVDNTSNATERAATATLTNKTINLTSNTLSGTLAQFNAALSDADFATGGGTATGSNTGDNAVNSLYSGLVSNATHTGDATGSTALTVVRINGTQLSSLATGLLKNTTGTGVPSIAVAGTDFLAPAAIGVSVQAYDVDTAKLDVAQSWTAQQTFKELKDTVHTITDGAGFSIDPANGSIQTITLGANRTPVATNFEAGQCVLLGIDDGTAYTITWTSVPVTWVKAGGTASAPTLATTGFTWVLLWEVGSTIYGCEVGKP